MALQFIFNASGNFYPFTLTRNVDDIRMGIFTPTERALLRKTDPAGTIITINNSIDIIKNNDLALREDFELVTAGRTSAAISSTNTLINPSKIFIEAGAKVEHCILNAGTGPIYIGRDAEIMEGSMIRGPFSLGEGSVVKMGSRIYGATTVGPHCNVAGEIKNSIFFGYSNKAHDGYLGDSIIGEWCNLGAGTSNSNVKNTAADVMVALGSETVDAGFKCGLLMGDYSRAAINTSFNTGTVVGVCCNIFYAGLTPKNIPSFSWGSNNAVPYELPKAFTGIDNWKKLKGMHITEKEKKMLERIYKELEL